MQAIRIHSYDGPEVMQLEELPEPIPQTGEVRVRVHAASLNFLDVQKRRGELVGQAFYRKVGGSADLPSTLGSQGVGIVEPLGPEVNTSRVGDRVSFVGESYWSYVVVPAVRLIRIPEALSMEQAAAGMNQ